MWLDMFICQCWKHGLSFYGGIEKWPEGFQRMIDCFRYFSSKSRASFIANALWILNNVGLLCFIYGFSQHLWDSMVNGLLLILNIVFKWIIIFQPMLNRFWWLVDIVIPWISCRDVCIFYLDFYEFK